MYPRRLALLIAALFLFALFTPAMTTLGSPAAAHTRLAAAHHQAAKHVKKKSSHKKKKHSKKHAKKHSKKKHHKKKSTGSTTNPVPATTASPADTFGTDYLSGTMQSAYTITMTGALSVGHMTDLDWDIPLPQSLKLDGYTEQVDAPTFQFNETPDSFTDTTDSNGHPVRRFHWNAPADNTPITFTETVHITTAADLTPFSSTAAYPLTNVPSDIQPYLAERKLLDLPDAANSVADGLKANQTTEQGVVVQAANWVATHTTYSHADLNTGIDATSAFNSGQAACRGYDDLLAGLLNKLGIPTQAEYGWVSSDPLSLPFVDGSTKTIQWSLAGSQGELHTWLNVWFPDKGWVPFDPQFEKFFVDTRHIGFVTNPDARDLSYGALFAGTVGPKLKSGNVVDFPADGSGSQVTLQVQDTMNLSFNKLVKDVKSAVLFAR